MKKYLVEMYDENKYVVQVARHSYGDSIFEHINMGLVRYSNFIFDVQDCKSIKNRYPTDDYMTIASKLTKFENSPILSPIELRVLYKHLFSSSGNL